MIDTQKLKQFPLAFKAFENYIEKQYGSVLFIYNGSGVVRNEDLVHWLDSVNCIINISYYPTKQNSFSFEVSCVGNWYCDKDFYNTRDETTELSILKAFELLETKLKTN